jgi:hypothetical protein
VSKRTSINASATVKPFIKARNAPLPPASYVGRAHAVFVPDIPMRPDQKRQAKSVAGTTILSTMRTAIIDNIKRYRFSRAMMWNNTAPLSGFPLEHF